MPNKPSFGGYVNDNNLKRLNYDNLQNNISTTIVFPMFNNQAIELPTLLQSQQTWGLVKLIGNIIKKLLILI